MTTISAGKTLGIFLNQATYTNPVVIDAGVTVSNSLGAAITTYHGSVATFAIRNNGAISGTTFGVYLTPGGSVTNAAGASITGASYAIYITNGAGTVVNNGNIVGAPSFGVFLHAGGSVTNAASGTITGLSAVFLVAGAVAGTLTNYGHLVGNGTQGAGVVMSGGGTITNAISASITGCYGIVAEAAGTVINNGAIADTGTGRVGVFLDAGGYLANGSAGSITGVINGVLMAGPGTVLNEGFISATGSHGIGVDMVDAGPLINAASGFIIGAMLGVTLDFGGTLVNAGTIAAAVGSTGTAVSFGGTIFDRLVLDPGFGFSGKVVASSNAGNTMELASAAAVGTVTGIGTEFINFYLIDFDPGAQWSISGGTAALAGGEVISGFTSGDTIDIVGVHETIGSFAAGVLSLTGSVPLDLLLPGDLATHQFRATRSTDGTDITIACFAAGTRIMTDTGECEVERLRPGMRVVSLSHRNLQPVVWIGHRRLDAPPPEAWPVRVSAGAFAAGVPHRDLLLSSDHAVLVGGVLIPIRYLINGVSIAQERRDEITYYHVELKTHGVLLADGLPAESYLDTGNRAAFAPPTCRRPIRAIEAAVRMGA